MKICKHLKVIVLVLAVAAGVVFAAATFLPASQPFGTIAPPVLSSSNLLSGDTVAYTPWFEDGSFQGDILAFKLDTNGSPDVLNPLWRAQTQVDAQDWLNGRHIVTSDGVGTAYPFRWAELTAGQQGMLTDETILNFVRGDRSQEGGGYRERNSVLGDIIHANPIYIGKPTGGYLFDNYLTFASLNANRAPRVYSGHNDGMVHAWDAETGDEVFAYVPAPAYTNLKKLAADPYSRQHFVDGAMTGEDIFVGGNWKTLLVAGMGAGGKGFIGLDVTDPSVVSDDDAVEKVLWEFNSSSAGSGNLGYAYSRPSIVRMADEKWYVVIGNGYLSAAGKASLFFLDAGTGSVVAEIEVPDTDGNGLSSPTLVDSDGDFMVDAGYAGDMNGNLWKFDLKDENPANWALASASPLFVTDQSAGEQPILTAPDVGRHPIDGFMVYIATGRLLAYDDSTDLSQQAVYGIWDKEGATLPVAVSSLVEQTLRSGTHDIGGSVRTATDNAVDYAVHNGWMTPTLVENAGLFDQGERVLTDIVLRDNRIQFMSTNPSVATGDNWFIQLNAFTGGAPDQNIIDVDGNQLLSVDDNIDGDGSGGIEDEAVDRVVGEFQSFGLASRPVIASITKKSSSALVNHLAAIDPVPPLYVFDPDDPGLQGGHFDLDTSHLIYDFSDGATDKHVHEWDDKYEATTIDYFTMLGGLNSIDTEGEGAGVNTDPFILTVGNAYLSIGGVMEINGSSMGVVDYQDLQARYLNGTLGPGEKFPRYTTGDPSGAQKAAGVKWLKSLKVSFNAFAILSGGLMGTNTGCVKDNEAGPNGEYRNGALVIQAVDAADEDPAYVYDAVSGDHVSANNRIKSVHHYAQSNLRWESTVFWHWDGDCYHEALWEEQWRICIIEAGCAADAGDAGEHATKTKDKDPEPEPEPVPDPGDPPPPEGVIDPDHSLSNTTIADDASAGRLFWRELIPED